MNSAFERRPILNVQNKSTAEHVHRMACKLVVCIVYVCLTSVLLVLSLYLFTDNFSKRYIKISATTTTTTTATKSSLNLVDVAKMFDSSNAKIDFPCPLLRLDPRRPIFPICTYTDSDLLSFTILRGGYLESTAVRRIVEVLEGANDDDDDGGRPTADFFVDLGANLGLYTLAVAHAGGRVIAVEANSATVRRLARSILVGDVGGRVTLLNNAISNRSGVEVRLGARRGNAADTYVTRGNRPCVIAAAASAVVGDGGGGGVPSDDELCLDTARTITLDDLLPLIATTSGSIRRRALIKADIQGSELLAFDERSSSRFFAAVDVPLIQMEWSLLNSDYDISKYVDVVGSPAEVERFVGFVRTMNYSFFDLATSKELGKDWRKWPSDILLLKKS